MATRCWWEKLRPGVWVLLEEGCVIARIRRRAGRWAWRTIEGKHGDSDLLDLAMLAVGSARHGRY